MFELAFFVSAREFDNQILVSTGIGITPALSVIEAHKESRTIFLVWATRDPTLVEFFLRNYHYLDHKFGFNYIYYTGKTPLDPTLLEGLASNVKLIYSRPNLESIIPNIIHASESSDTKSKDAFQKCSKCEVIQRLMKKSKEFDVITEVSPLSDEEKLEELTAIAEDSGHDISELSSHFQDAAIACPFTPPTTKKATRRGSRVAPMPLPPDAVDPSMTLKRIRKYADTWRPTLHASRSIKKMEHKASLLSRWGVMYCGKGTLKSTLKKISKEYEIDLHYESFSW